MNFAKGVLESRKLTYKHLEKLLVSLRSSRRGFGIFVNEVVS